MATLVTTAPHGATLLSSQYPSLPSGIYFKDLEIAPAVQGVFRWDASNAAISEFPPAVEVRAAVEGQVMAKWVHAHKLGYQITPSSRVLATGGGSRNTAILQAWLWECAYMCVHVTLSLTHTPSDRS